MLKGIHPLLNADLLYAMAALGHGDTIASVDANFPAATNARRLLQASGSDAPTVLDAILTLFPLDVSSSPPVFTMQVEGDPDALPEVVTAFAATLARHGLEDTEIGHLPRHTFYARAREASAIVRTGELRPYGNLLLVKGVVERYGNAPDGGQP